jgi:hypothetical protein
MERLHHLRPVAHDTVVKVSGIAVSMVLAMMLSACGPPSPVSSIVSVNPAVTHQTFRGWEAAILASVLDYRDDLPGFGELFRQAASDLGITRVQVAITSGMEQPPGHAAEYVAGTISEHTFFTQYAYNVVNDNDDPAVADRTRFDFTLIDWQMQHLVVPFKRQVAAAGRVFWMDLSYVDFQKSDFKHYDRPDEYAEFMSVLFHHLDTAYGVVPDAINVVNEPDLTSWTGAMIGRVIVATAKRLAADGYTPGFIVPSTTDRGKAVRYFDEITAVRGAAEHIRELSYHCYHDTGSDSLTTIARRAIRAGIDTAQNECWQSSNDAQALHRDLKVGMNSAWQQATFNGQQGYYAVDRANGRVTLRPKTRILQQYYRHIRAGAIRIEADSTNQAMDPIAFINADGRYVTIVLANSAGSVTIEHLPPGVYGISYSTPDASDVRLPDAALSTGQAITTAIPAPGVLTVYAK